MVWSEVPTVSSVRSQVVDVHRDFGARDQHLELFVAEHVQPLDGNNVRQAPPEGSTLLPNLPIQFVVGHMPNIFHTIGIRDQDVGAVRHKLLDTRLAQLVGDHRKVEPQIGHIAIV